MVESGQDLGFTTEPRDTFRIGRKDVRKNLDRDISIEFGVGCPVHLAHSTGTEPRRDSVVCERLSNHLAGKHKTFPLSGILSPIGERDSCAHRYFRITSVLYNPRGLKEATGSAGRVQPSFTFNQSLHVLRARLFADPGKNAWRKHEEETSR